LKLQRYAVVGYSHGSIEAAKLLVSDKRVSCAVLGGIGDGLADENWKVRHGVGKLAAELEAKVAQMFLEERRGQEACVLLAWAGVQHGQSVTSAEELATVQVPVLCINGMRDTDNGSKDNLASLIPGSELLWVEGNHATAMADPNFCSNILRFLAADRARGQQEACAPSQSSPLDETAEAALAAEIAEVPEVRDEEANEATEVDPAVPAADRRPAKRWGRARTAAMPAECGSDGSKFSK